MRVSRTAHLGPVRQPVWEKNVGLYRDDGLAAFEDISGPQAERIKKDITKFFSNLGLKITIKTNLRIVDFLDVTLNLSNGTYSPFRKPNDHPLYINTKSNHPPTITKHLPAAISRRVSEISCNKEVFEKAKPDYQQALRASCYTEDLTYTVATENENVNKKKNRKRKIIWFNPPYSKSVQTNIRKTFLRLLQKHFPKNQRFHKIFNKNTVKVSYSCMENMGSIIKKHNKKILSNTPAISDDGCNCRSKDQCPIENKCLSSALVYNATVTTNDSSPGENYIRLTEGTFKKRFYGHQLSIKDRKYAKSTELSKHLWKLKDKGQQYNIKWTIKKKATPYSNGSKRCNLCLTEKLCILKADRSSLLNKRSELISKCRHENKFYIMNYKGGVT